MSTLDLTGVGAVSDLIGTVINKIWPDKTEQEKQQLAAAVMVVQGQLDINKAEAANPSVFVSGWRPFIGWVCGAGCAWNWIGLPVMKATLAMTGMALNVSPADLTEMLPLLFGMLGLGAMRSYEKVQGVARN
jgi:Holin of 3TMs, for gene-transfer release